MKTRFYLSVLWLTLLVCPAEVLSQTVNPEKVITPIGYDVLQKLSDIPQVPPGYVDRTWKERVIPNKDGFLEEFNIPSAWTGRDPVLQDNTAVVRAAATIDKNFSGMSNTSGVAPPDTDGDVGLAHYMQMVNLSTQIWNKEGISVYGPVPSSTLWNGFIGPWTGTNNGDPIVLYDQYADRWIATQFSLPNYPNGPFYELVAVSQTGNPTGGWYRYAYEFANMPDYPKFGIWTDGYYLTINQFAPPLINFAGAGVCVLDRAAMLAGAPNAQMLFFNLGTAYGSLLPADADGPGQPPAGSPHYLANLSTNSLRIWKATIDWANTGNSTVSVLQTMSTQSFSYSGITINQPGTSQTLDPLASRLMYRLQYRKFSNYEVMLANHTVNANGSGQAGVRWYELRRTTGNWYIYQQGTYAPADGNDRWMASVAMNGSGDIGIGYSVSGSSTYPAVRFSGQTAANSGTGILDVNETEIDPGVASQTGVSRWGDYSMMSVDPSDDATFWYTNEYSNGDWNWKTKIASFAISPPLVLPPVADFSASPNPVMATQQVSFSDLSSNNPTSWSWSFESGTPATSTEQNPVVTYTNPGIYDVVLTAANSAGNNTRTVQNYLTVTEFILSYCTSSGSNTSREWINSLTLGSFVNTSGSDNGFGNFTLNPIPLFSGNSYNLSLVPGFSGKSRMEYWRAWIDFNIDGDFLDPGELVFSADAQKTSVSGMITIPEGLTGETRMRISMKYNAIPTSCEQFVFGEVEDYTLSLTVPVPQAPVADFTGTPTNVVTGNVVQFTDQSQYNPTSWTWIFDGGDPTTSTLQNPAVMYTAAGTYTVSLTATNGVGSDIETKTGYITVIAPGTYCESHSNSLTEYIAKVNAGSFSNTSGASQYSDYTGMTINLAPGSTNSLVLTPNNSVQREFWRLWIDYNGDGDFLDLDEQVFAANNKKGVVSGSLTIPSTATGQTRLRITMKNGSSPVPCEIFPVGEVEDYTVNFGNGPSDAIREHKLILELFPNPASEQLNLEVKGASETVNIKVYNMLGQIIDDFTMKSARTILDLKNYKKGMYYIGADDGIQNTLKKFIRE